jgi:hypothetical protein
MRVDLTPEAQEILDGTEYNIYLEDAQDLYFMGAARGEDANDAINSLLKTKEIDLDANLFAVKVDGVEGPFVIRINPSAVLASEMVQVA